MNPSSFRRPLLLLLAVFISDGCSNDSSSGSTESAPPEAPVLEFEGAQNGEGVSFASDAKELVVSCDPRLTIILGPNTSTTPGLLDNWKIRPVGGCDDNPTCGYLRVLLLDEDGETLFEANQASTAVVLDLEDIAIEKVEEIEAYLVDGTTSEVFEIEGEALQASWTVRIKEDECEQSALGGAGGDSGAGGAGGAGGDMNP